LRPFMAAIGRRRRKITAGGRIAGRVAVNLSPAKGAGVPDEAVDREEGLAGLVHHLRTGRLLRALGAPGERSRKMAICDKLRKFLDDNHVRYVTIAHSPAFTAQEIAASAHVKGHNVVKCVMVRGDGEHYMAALSANQRLDLGKFRKALGIREAHIEREEEFEGLFEDCELGAMPPFGNLYRLPVVMDETLARGEEIVFNGGSHATVVRMKFEDYERLVAPMENAIAERAA